MATTTVYCLRKDIEDKLSDAGMRYCLDDANKGTLSLKDLERLDRFIEQASARIDRALQTKLAVPITQNTTAMNKDLTQICVNLVVARVIARRGARLPQTILDDLTDAKEYLQQIKEGFEVPGLTYPARADVTLQREMGRPMNANPIRRR